MQSRSCSESSRKLKVVAKKVKKPSAVLRTPIAIPAVVPSVSH
jgi:hypothetical protein